jgi:phenylalanyl-tRNA synthetase beta chain
MKIALDWIGQYLAPVPAAQVAADALLNAGLPIESIEAFGGTSVLDVEVTSNRPDCLSHVGLARELGAIAGGTFTGPKIALQEVAPAAATLTAVNVEDPAGCPYYSARVLRGVKVGPSPAWLVARLESIGLRSVNNVVDITNFVLMELGQPLHAFDFDGLAEKRIVVRRARKGERIVAIDAKTYEIDPSMLVIADARNPVAIAGVMGGKLTEVTENTRNVLLESARFEPLTIRTTSRALALKSDSSYRFERGLDPSLAEQASQRAAQLVLELCGGTLAQGVVAVGSAACKSPAVSLRMKRIAEILGITIPAERAVEILARLHFQPQLQGEVIACTVPSHRLDIEREIDLLEEVARVYGYGHIPTLDRVVHAVQPEPAAEKAARLIKSTLVAAGFSETITVTFIGKADAEAFLPAGARGIPLAHGGWKGEVLRTSLFPSLLAVRRTNQHAGTSDARLFEVSERFWQEGVAAQSAPTQQRVLTILGNSVAEVRGALEAVLERLNVQAKLVVTPSAGGTAAYFAGGVAGEVSVEVAGRSVKLGGLGQFTQELQKKYDLRQAVCGAEVLYEPLIELFQPVRRARPLPRFPGVKRDLSVVVDEAVRWSEVEAALRGAGLEHMEAIDFVTTFRNKQVGEGKKSLTLALDFRDPARTLKSEEVDAQVKTAVGLLGARFGAVLRA